MAAVRYCFLAKFMVLFLWKHENRTEENARKKFNEDPVFYQMAVLRDIQTSSEKNSTT